MELLSAALSDPQQLPWGSAKLPRDADKTISCLNPFPALSALGKLVISLSLFFPPET